MALATLAKVKALCRIPAAITTYDALISTCVLVANETVRSETGLDAVGTVTVYNEKFDMDWEGIREISLTYRPVVSVTALTLDGTLKGSDKYYVADFGTIKLTGASDYLPVGRQLISVCYTAGFTTAPEDLQHAATLIAASHFNQGAHVGIARQSVGGYSLGMADGGAGSGIPTLANRILAKYRRIFPRPAGGAFG